MKKLLATLLLFSTCAQAGLPPTSVQGQSDTSPQTKFSFQVPYNQKTDLGGIKALFETGNNNWLVNPSFEHTTYSTGWTITKTSGTTFAGAVETTVIGHGKQSAKITATAAYGTLIQSVTPTVYTASQNLEASCKVNVSSATGVVQVCGLAGGVEQNCTTVPVSSTWQTVTTNFVGPANGTSVGVEIKSTVADSTSWYVDDCYVGPARNLGSGTFTTPWQSYTPTFTGFGTVTVLNLQWMRSGPNLKISGTFTAGTPTATEARVSLPNNYSTPSGLPTLSSAGAWFKDASSTNKGGPILIEPSIGYITFSDTATFGASSTAALAKAQGSSIVSAGNIVSFTAEIPITQFTDQSFYSPSATPASWSGAQNASCTFAAVTSSSMADSGASSNAGCALTTYQNRNFGSSVSMYGGTGTSAKAGLVFTPPRAGNHFVCANFSLTGSASSNAGWQMIDGSSNVIAVGNFDVGTNVTGVRLAQSACGVVSVASTSTSTTVKIQAFSSSGSMSVSPSNTNATSVNWSIVELDAPMPAPYLTGSVTSNTSGSERVERVRTTVSCTGSPCTIDQSGSWVTSITRSATGTYTLNIVSGSFSATPTCVCSDGNPTAGRLCGVSPSSSTSASITRSVGNTTAEDGLFDIICMGPR